jgi:lysyl-tRNA synthetase class II
MMPTAALFMALSIWIATLGAGQEHRVGGAQAKRKRKVCDLNHAVESPMLQRELGHTVVPEPSKIVGAAVLHPAFAYDHPKILSPAQRE